MSGINVEIVESVGTLVEAAPDVPSDVIEVDVPGMQGPQGDRSMCVQATPGAAYPARPFPQAGVTFVGDVDPTALMLVGDSWINTAAIADYTLYKGDKGDPGDVSAANSNTWTGALGTISLPVPTTLTRTLSGNVTITAITDGAAGQSYTATLVLKQAATGGPYTVAWPAALEWPSDAPGPAMPTAANSELIVHLFWTGVAWRAFPAGVFFP